MQHNPWLETKKRFDELVDLTPEERKVVIDGIEDDSVRNELSALLRAHDSSQGMLEVNALGEPVDSDHSTFSDDLTGSSVDDFQVIRRIGEGGWGVVYEAYQASHNRTVALKVLRPGMASRKMVRRFHNEAEILSSLDENGVAKLYAARTTRTLGGERHYIAMQMINGLHVDRYVKQASPNTHSLIELIAQICDVVDAAHQHGVIHRDLKPGNIFIDEHGQPVVLDFGIAMVQKTESDHSTMHTRQGEFLGTLNYMSPEQLEGDVASVGASSDVYSLAVVAYELLTGARPFDFKGLAPQQAAELIRSTPVPRMRELDASVRVDLEKVLTRALSAQRNMRYRSAGELADDLRRVVEKKPVHARPVTIRYMASLWVRRNPFAARAGLLAAAIAVTLVGSVVAAEIRDNAFQSRRVEASRLYNVAVDFTRRNVLLEDALDQLNEAIALDPGFVDAYFERAQTLEKLAKAAQGTEEKEALVNEALQSYQDAHSVAMPDGFPRALLAAGKLCSEQRRGDEAIEYFEDAAYFDDTDVYARIAKAAHLARTCQREETLAIFEELVNDPIASQLHETFGLIGEVHTRQILCEGELVNPFHDQLKGAQAFERAIELYPTHAQYYRGLGINMSDSYYETKDFKTPLEAYNRAFLLDSTLAVNARNIAVKYWENRRRDKQREYHRIAYDLDPNHEWNVSDWAFSFYESLLFEEALEKCELMQSRFGYFNHVLKLMVLHKMGRNAEAHREALDAAQAQPENVKAWINLGTYSDYAGEFEDALTAWQRVEELEPSSESIRGIARATYELEGEAAAVAILESAMQDHIDPLLQLELAKIASKRGDEDGADDWAEKALESCADNVPALLKAGEGFEEQERDHLAAEAYEQVLMRDPHSHDGRTNYVYLLLKSKDPNVRDAARAVPIAHTLAVKNTRFGEAADQLALALVRAGDPEEALEAVDHAIKLRGGLCHQHLWKAQALANLGETSLARANLYIAVDMYDSEKYEWIEFDQEASELADRLGIPIEIPN